MEVAIIANGAMRVNKNFVDFVKRQKDKICDKSCDAPGELCKSPVRWFCIHITFFFLYTFAFGASIQNPKYIGIHHQASPWQKLNMNGGDFARIRRYFILLSIYCHWHGHKFSILVHLSPTQTPQFSLCAVVCTQKCPCWGPILMDDASCSSLTHQPLHCPSP